ncbi:MAG: hypothetical protein JSS77_13955 [Acidobacteria bacterium]|nr:hypothetical protein [Acidobacteriota bacterium]
MDAKNITSLKYRLIFGAAYTIGYFFLAALGMGGDPVGSGAVFLSPILPWPILFIVIGMLGHLADLQRRIFAIGLILIHYVLTFAFLYIFSGHFDFVRSGFAKAWQDAPGFVVFIIGWYAIGQGIIWAVVALEARQHDLES